MDRERWLRQRRTGIGASDAAAVAGVGLWASPYSTYMEKIGEGTPVEQTERMTWGLLLEKPIAQEWAQREGVTNLRRMGFRRHPAIPYLLATPDFEGDHPEAGHVVIETKVSETAGEWSGVDGVDQIPMQYFLQVQHQLIVTGLRTGFLVVLIRGNELRSWRIEADPEVIAGLLEAYEDFWLNHVVPRIPPEVDGSDPTTEALKRRHRKDEGEEIVASAEMVDLIDALIEARQDAGRAEERKQLWENRLKERMGKAARLVFPGGSITWKQNRPSLVIGWEQIAKGYRAAIERIRERRIVNVGNGATIQEVVDGVLSEGFGTTNLDEIESIHTNTRDGARPFRLTLKGDE